MTLALLLDPADRGVERAELGKPPPAAPPCDGCRMPAAQVELDVPHVIVGPDGEHATFTNDGDGAGKVRLCVPCLARLTAIGRRHDR